MGGLLHLVQRGGQSLCFDLGLVSQDQDIFRTTSAVICNIHILNEKKTF